MALNVRFKEPRSRKPALRRGLRQRKANPPLRSLLADIVESSNDAIYSRKLDGTISSWNRAAERLFGFTAREIIGSSSAVLLPPDRSGETRRLLEKVRRGGRVDHFETYRLRKDGSRRLVSLTVSPVYNNRGWVIGASTIARDMTEQRELQSQILEVTEAERRRVGRELHDGLGQQLSGLELLCRTLARSLAKHGLPEARTARLLVAQMQSANRQSRALARGLTPVIEHPNGLMVALEELVRTTRAIFRVDCSFVCEEPVLVREHGAAVHLFRIAQEAVTNALRHGRAKRITIRVQRKLKWLALEIEDRGRGMEGKEPGGGLGLRLMQFRARQLRGTLRFKDLSPHGLVVSCTVPLEQGVLI